MKSRGTVVDADDLIEDMIASAKEQTEALGKIDDFTDEEKTILFRTIGLGALKFFLLSRSKREILFDPKRKYRFTWLYRLICTIYVCTHPKYFRKVNAQWTIDKGLSTMDYQLHSTEKELIKILYKYEMTLQESCKEMNPAKLLDYVYDIAKTYNKFYNDCSILSARK